MMRIKIGPLSYELRVEPNPVDENGAPVDGLIDDVKRLMLKVNSNLDPQAQFFTLWHEALHGIEYNNGIDLGEPLVDLLASNIMQILADNPCMRLPPTKDGQ